MALNAFLTLKIGGQQVLGSSRFKKREGFILVNGMYHEVRSARNEAGHPTGAPKHRSLVVIKDIDVASPILAHAMSINASCSNFVLEFSRYPPSGGGEEFHYSIGLEGAKISSIRSVMPNLRSQGLELIPEYEEVAFTYSTISWNWLGKGEVGTEAYTEQECDFSEDRPSWTDTLDLKLREHAKQIGITAGQAAKNAIKEAMKEATGGGDPGK